MSQSTKSMEKASAERRSFIREALQNAQTPLTATYFAKHFSVSRQVIVGDVAILRASGLEILATPRGYLCSASKPAEFPFTGMLACRHESEQLRDELYTIVDYGATVIDVSIEHAIYGELCGKLDLSSRYDVDQFVYCVEAGKNSVPISSLTEGVHLHRIGCKDQAVFERIKAELIRRGIAIG